MKAKVRNSDGMAVARAIGLSKRMARAIYRSTPKKQRPLCGARRRDGGSCQARAVCDPLTGEPLHGGRCRMHGGTKPSPKRDQIGGELEALDVLEAMLQSDSERIRLRAAKDILDRAGL